MRKFLFLPWLVAVFVLLNGCAGIGEKIFVDEPSHVEIVTIDNNKVQILTVLPISNDNGFRIKLKDLDLEARINGTYLGPVKNMEPVIIPGHSKDEYPIMLELEIKNILVGLTAMYKIAQGNNRTKISLEGHITARSFLVNKKIPVKEDNLLQYMN